MISQRALYAALLPALLLTAPATSQQSAQKTAELIRTADLQADLFFLASDALAGRNAGSLGDRVATDYIAAEFMRLGLKPVGDNGTWFQNMDLVYGRLDRDHT